MRLVVNINVNITELFLEPLFFIKYFDSDNICSFHINFVVLVLNVHSLLLFAFVSVLFLFSASLSTCIVL